MTFGQVFDILHQREEDNTRLSYILSTILLILWRHRESKDQQTWRWHSFVRIMLFLHQKCLIVSSSLGTRMIYFVRKYISILYFSEIVFTKYAYSLWYPWCHIPVPCQSTDVVTAIYNRVSLNKALHPDPRHYVTCYAGKSPPIVCLASKV